VRERSHGEEGGLGAAGEWARCAWEVGVGGVVVLAGRNRVGVGGRVWSSGGGGGWWEGGGGRTISALSQSDVAGSGGGP